MSTISIPHIYTAYFHSAHILTDMHTSLTYLKEFDKPKVVQCMLLFPAKVPMDKVTVEVEWNVLVDRGLVPYLLEVL